MSARTPLSFPAPLAAFATRAEKTRGRLHVEPESATRTPFQRDRDRVIHAIAFRRLKRKTQVFISHEGDHYRTRLTHSLEVAQISRSLARMLRLDEDLAECVALAHDLGHPPFGHTGEDVLQDCMSDFGGFDHNAQTLRVLTKLEHRHARFEGLNLSWETLEGVVKHNGPLTGANADKGDALPAAIVEYARLHDLELDSFAGLEAQIAAVSDDIAYNNHDVDDGLRAGLISFDQALSQPLIGESLAQVIDEFPDAPRPVQIAEAVSGLIGVMVDDVARQTRANLDSLAPRSAADIRGAGRVTADFSPEIKAQLEGLRAFLHQNVYRHYKVNRARSSARRIVRALFEQFFNEPGTLPPEWRSRFDDGDACGRARAVCDYIAGMTDRFALREHHRLFGGGPVL